MKPLQKVALGLGLVTLGALGGELFRRETAHAQPRPAVTQCFAATLWAEAGRSVNGGDIPDLVRVPTGWTPVGGTVVGTNPAVVLCR